MYWCNKITNIILTLGKWSNPTPTCEEIKCKKQPELPKYGSVDVSSTDEKNIGSVATYSCDKGFEITNETNTVC